MVSCRQSIRLLLGMCFICPVFGLEDDRLWLPKSYQKYYLPLVSSAQAAESIDRCMEVIEGTIDLEQSQPDHPIFRIVCRQENKMSYVEMVDGISYETLTTPKVVEPILTEAEREALRIQEEAKKAKMLERKAKDFWVKCDHVLKTRTRMMVNLQWLTPMPPQPVSVSEEDAEFKVNFDAENMWGKALHYEALCTVTSTAPAEIIVRKRQ